MSKRISNNSIDMILADLPYEVTQASWDSLIPLEPLWKQYKRIAEDDTAIVLTASQPFTTKLINSNPNWFKYEWMWRKNNGTGFAFSEYQPMRYHEEILVFYKTPPTYRPQDKTRFSELSKQRHQYTKKERGSGKSEYLDMSRNERTIKYDSETKDPESILFFKIVDPTHRVHSAQKPVDLFKYLIKTYTNKGDVVLDNVIGSGTTAVAAKGLDRKYIGFEQDEEYYEIAQNRVSEVQKELI